MSSEPDKPARDDADWIDTAARAAGALGFSEVKVRWKLRRWSRSRDRSERVAEQRREHVGYAHKTCSQCGAVNDRSETACTRCGARLYPRWVQVLGRLGLGLPSWSVSHLLGLAIAIIYARMMMASPGADILSMDLTTIVAHGARAPMVEGADQWWRWATSIFLHFGLWHLGFNLFALAIVGPVVEEIYGRGSAIFLFLVTGVVASAGSDLIGGSGVAAGASGAVLGLIGVAAGWGQRRGTSHGHEVRNRMLMWLLYTLVFGFFIGADNWAHGIGFASGAAFGFAVPNRATGRGVNVLMGVTGAVGCAAAVTLCLIGGHLPTS